MPQQPPQLPSRINWLPGPELSEEERQAIYQADINHETNIYGIRGLDRIPASALGCLLVVQIYGFAVWDLEGERASRIGEFPTQKWIRSFRRSPYLALTAATERQVLDFWTDFKATTLFRDVWLPWLQRMSLENVRERFRYMQWLISRPYGNQKRKWDEYLATKFVYHKTRFGFEILDTIPHWNSTHRSLDWTIARPFDPATTGPPLVLPNDPAFYRAMEARDPAESTETSPRTG